MWVPITMSVVPHIRALELASLHFPDGAVRSRLVKWFKREPTSDVIQPAAAGRTAGCSLLTYTKSLIQVTSADGPLIVLLR